MTKHGSETRRASVASGNPCQESHLSPIRVSISRHRGKPAAEREHRPPDHVDLEPEDPLLKREDALRDSPTPGQVRDGPRRSTMAGPGDVVPSPRLAELRQLSMVTLSRRT